ncbi:hypothetical protein BDW22DRAFT_54143 [Trametopsis cervina]|nr:hypothetical protein BDW22DRAFT_54143 [Trametopsis cervina]
MTRLTLIVAATLQNGIGQSGRLPWRLPQEMAYFARATTSAPDGRTNALVMGRATWESIPPKFRPLPKRLNVVVSRNTQYELGATDALLAPSLPASLDALTQRTDSVHRTFIIGGASLYTESLRLTPSDPAFVDRILLTRIVSPAFDECDTFVPKLASASPDVVANETEGVSWKRASHAELQTWVGFEVPEGVQEEKGVQYEFQMWTRTGEII